MTARADAPPAERGTGYWQIVWREFRENRGSTAGVVFVGLLFAIALLAPVLANRYPFVWTADGETSFPFFRQFFAPTEPPEWLLETVYNYLLLAIPCGLVIGRIAGGRRRGAALAAAGVVLLLPFLLVGGRLDPTDYRQAAEAGAGRGVFPPVPYGPFETGFGHRIPPTWWDAEATEAFQPGTYHFFGTDNAGRDVLVRLIHGARVSLAVGIVSVGIATLIGVVIGSLKGYFGGWVDILLSRLTEIMICFPTFFLILALISVMEQRSILNVMLVIGVTRWTGVARLVRGEILKQRALDYVAAAQALGAGSFRIIFRHILPNAMAPVLVSMTFMVAGSILVESGLSFLGFGVDIPTASWGELLNQAREAPTVYWWLVVFPGVPIFLTVMTYNMVGQGLRDAMDPRLRSGRV